MHYVRSCSALVLFYSAFIMNASANSSIMTLVPSTTTIQIRADGAGVAAYTLTNSTKGMTLTDFTIYPGAGGGNSNHLFVQNNTCTSALAPNASCTFQILIEGINQSSSFTLSPEVCAMNGTACSVAIDDYRPTVTVVTPVKPVSAYFALTSGSLQNNIQPVLASNQSLQTPIPGFNFDSPISKSLESPLIPVVGTALAPNGGTLYVTNPGSAQVSVVNVAATPATVTNIDLPVIEANNTLHSTHAPTGIVVTPNNQDLYVTNLSGSEIFVINVNDHAIQQINIPTSKCRMETTASCRMNTEKHTSNIGNLAMAPNGETVYVSNGTYLTGINTQSLDTNLLVCGVLCESEGMIVSPDNTLLYIANTGDDSVIVYDTVNDAFVSIIFVGSNPTRLALSPNGGTLYVLNTGDATLSVIDTTSYAVNVVSLPSSGSTPTGLALTPDGTQLYVSYADSNAAQVINTTTFTAQAVDVTGDQGNIAAFAG